MAVIWRSKDGGCLLLRQGLKRRIAAGKHKIGTGPFHIFIKRRGEFLLMCLVHNVKKIVRKVFQGTFTLLRRYRNLINEAMPGYRVEQLTLIGIVVLNRSQN